MPTVKLLHSLRDVAGEGETVLPGDTVREVLRALGERYGVEFQIRLKSCKVTVNGLNVVSLGGVCARVSPTDVIALVPPMLGEPSES